MIGFTRLSRYSNNSASRITPYLTTSPSPAMYSRSGSVFSVSVSINTARGCKNAPTMFLASVRLIPTLPPTELSTWARSVVGTCTKRIPRA